MMRRCGIRAAPTHPYALEPNTTPIPIYQVSYGRIAKRQWNFRNVAWCEICKEPISSWVNHIGRKDHALLDLHYSQVVEFPRHWDPVAVLTECLCGLAKRRGMAGCHDVIRREEQARRNEVHSMIRYLVDKEVLKMGDVRQTFLQRMQGGLRGMDCQGAMVFHEQLLPTLLRLYPGGHIFDYSNFVDFMSCAYNLETVYDLLGIYQIDSMETPARVTSPAAAGFQGIAASFPCDTREEKIDRDASVSSSKETDEDALFSHKAMIIRSILGQLRWSTMEGQTHPTGRSFAPYLINLAEILLKALVAEHIHVRICEYMIRAEPAWVEFGFEQKKRNAKEFVAESGVPSIPRTHFRPLSSTYDDYYRVAV